MEPITGRRPFLTAARAALRGRDGAGLAAGGATLAFVVAADLLLPGQASLTGMYVLAPFVAACFAALEATLVLAILALAVGGASGSWNADFGQAEYLIRLAGLAAGGIFATLAAFVLRRLRLGSGRLRVLNEAAAVADGSLDLTSTLARVTELIVPAAADVCMVDVIRDGRVLRAAVRAGGHPDAERAERGVRERHPSLPAWMVEGVPQWRHLSRLVPRMRDEDLVRMATDEKDLEFLRWLAPRSSIVAPMIARGRSLGALTLVTAWSRRRYTRDDVRFAEIIARRLALALENAGLFSDLESVERRLDAVMSMVSEAVWVHDADGVLVFANLAAARLLGFATARELMDARPEIVRDRVRVLDEEGRAVGGSSWPAYALAPTGAPWRGMRRVIAAGDRERWLRVATEEIRGLEGERLYAITTAGDVTEVKRAELAQRLLADAGELLAGSLDYRRTLAALADLLVPRFASGCEVMVAREDGSLERIAAVRHATNGAGPASAAVPAEEQVRDAIRTGIARRERGSIVAPMTAGRSALGAIRFVGDDRSRAFDDLDLEVARELGRRAGVAFANARLAAERARIARTLQEGLLPPQLPRMPGWEAAAMYRPAGEVNDVGGDFYDAFEHDEGWVVTVGDVVGRGAQAATVTALARYTIRTACALTGDPVAALRALDRSLKERGRGASLCSAVVVMLPRRSDGRAAVARVVCAGHPPPLVLRGDTAEELPPGGPILGALDDASWHPREVELRAGDQLLLYTDGVVDAKGPDGRFGAERLRAGLAAGATPAATIAAIERRLEAFAGGDAGDDAAAVVVQRVAGPARKAQPDEAGRAMSHGAARG